MVFRGRELPIPTAPMRQSWDHWIVTRSPSGCMVLALISLRSTSHHEGTRPTFPARATVHRYMDAISLHAAGFSNVVACMGTSLNEAQLEAAAMTSPARRVRRVVPSSLDWICPGCCVAAWERRMLPRAVGYLAAAAARVRIRGAPNRYASLTKNYAHPFVGILVVVHVPATPGCDWCLPEPLGGRLSSRLMQTKPDNRLCND